MNNNMYNSSMYKKLLCIERRKKNKTPEPDAHNWLEGKQKIIINHTKGKLKKNIFFFMFSFL